MSKFNFRGPIIGQFPFCVFYVIVIHVIIITYCFFFTVNGLNYILIKGKNLGDAFPGATTTATGLSVKYGKILDQRVTPPYVPRSRSVYTAFSKTVVERSYTARHTCSTAVSHSRGITNAYDNNAVA